MNSLKVVETKIKPNRSPDHSTLYQTSIDQVSIYGRGNVYDVHHTVVHDWLIGTLGCKSIFILIFFVKERATNYQIKNITILLKCLGNFQHKPDHSTL